MKLPNIMDNETWQTAIRTRFFNPDYESGHPHRPRLNITPSVLAEPCFRQLGGEEGFIAAFRNFKIPPPQSYFNELYFYFIIYSFATKGDNTFDKSLHIRGFPQYICDNVTNGQELLKKITSSNIIYYKDFNFNLHRDRLSNIWHIRAESELTEEEYGWIKSGLEELRDHELCPDNCDQNDRDFITFSFYARDFLMGKFHWPIELCRIEQRYRKIIEDKLGYHLVVKSFGMAGQKYINVYEDKSGCHLDAYSMYLANLAMWLPGNNPGRPRPKQKTGYIKHQSKFIDIELKLGLVRDPNNNTVLYLGFGIWAPENSGLEGTLRFGKGDDTKLIWLDCDSSRPMVKECDRSIYCYNSEEHFDNDICELEADDSNREIAFKISNELPVLLSEDEGKNLYPVLKISEANMILGPITAFEKIRDALWDNGNGSDAKNRTNRLPDNLKNKLCLIEFEIPARGFKPGFELPGLGIVGDGKRQWSIAGGLRVFGEEGNEHKSYFSYWPPEIRIPDDSERFGQPYGSTGVELVEVNAPNQVHSQKPGLRIWHLESIGSNEFPELVTISVLVDGEKNEKTILFPRESQTEVPLSESYLDCWGRWSPSMNSEQIVGKFDKFNSIPGELVEQLLGHSWEVNRPANEGWLCLLRAMAAKSKTRSRFTYQAFKSTISKIIGMELKSNNLFDQFEYIKYFRQLGVINIETATNGKLKYIHAQSISASLFPNPIPTGNTLQHAAVLNGAFNEVFVNEMPFKAIKHDVKIFVNDKGFTSFHKIFPPRVVVRGKIKDLVSFFKDINVKFSKESEPLSLLSRMVKTGSGLDFIKGLEYLDHERSGLSIWEPETVIWKPSDHESNGLFKISGDRKRGEPPNFYYYSVNNRYYKIPEPNWFFWREKNRNKSNVGYKYHEDNWELETIFALPFLLERILAMISGIPPKRYQGNFVYCFVSPEIFKIIKSKIFT